MTAATGAARAARPADFAGLRVLLAAFDPPQPDRDSGSRRAWQIAELLQELGATVSVLATHGGSDRLAERQLAERGIAFHDGTRSQIGEVLATAQLDLAYVLYWPNAAQLLPEIRAHAPACRVVVDSVDLHFLRLGRQAWQSPLRGSVGLDEASAGFMAQELNTYASADALVAVSRKEAGLLETFFPDGPPAFFVPDFEELRPSAVPFADRKGIVSIGSYRHPPNRQAVAFLCNEVLPRVPTSLLAEHPVSIVGSGLDASILALARGLPWMRMVGWVPSVMPYLERGRVSVVPLLLGAGTKRKLVQALAVGTPSVSTSIGAEGLDLVDGEHVLIADDPAAFAAAIERLLTDEALWQRLANAGLEHVRRTNGKELASAQLAEVLGYAREARPSGLVPVRLPGAIRPAPPVQALESDEPNGQGAVRQSLRRARTPLRRLSERVIPALGLNPLFDRGWYLAQNPDARGSRLPAQWHYRRHGWQEGRWPNPWFDPGFYLAQHPEVAASGTEPLEHYLRIGGNQGLPASTRFDTARYLQENPDVAAAGLHPLVHFLQHGRFEGRVAPTYDFAGTSQDVTGRRALTESVPATPVRDDTGRNVPATRGDGVRLLAFYLPQFHPIPENDEWWGAGFTEWRNVARADALFPGHEQPRVPGQLGFYDLRLEETRLQQAKLAREHGVDGFVYYHYWFMGKQLLERPFQEVLRSGKPDLPFALCWANDPWSRAWDGREDQLLQEQRYSAADDDAHIRAILPALADARAIRVNGKPMFLVYRARSLPDPERTTDSWREEVARSGLPGVYLVAVETSWDLGWDATTVGFDAKVLFQPQFQWLQERAARTRVEVLDHPGLQVHDYEQVRRLAETTPRVDYRRFETVVPGWDNTPRVGDRGVVLHGATPDGYGEWLRGAIARAASLPESERLVFINAWNEWAEGCHLEPDRRNGLAYLEATLRARQAARG